jgi:hypothetical protein
LLLCLLFLSLRFSLFDLFFSRTLHPSLSLPFLLSVSLSHARAHTHAHAMMLRLATGQRHTPACKLHAQASSLL